MLFAMAALLAGLMVAPALAQSDEPTPAPSQRPPQQVGMDVSYVFDGHSSLRAEMKQIYNKKDGTSVYFGEEFGFWHSTCGSAAFCNNVGGHDTDLRLGVQVMPDIFIAAGSGSFAGNGLSLTGLGFGVEKLARGEKPMELTASYFYYPGAVGTYSCPLRTTPCYATPVVTNPEYSVSRYAVGGNYVIQGKPFYVTFGIAGDNATQSNPTTLQPQTFTHNGAYLGLGLRM